MMRRKIKAIFPDENPLNPRIIECEAEITPEGIFTQWIFDKGTDIADILFFLEFTSDEKCKAEILGYED